MLDGGLENVGRKALIRAGRLLVEVVITSAKPRAPGLRYRVEPVRGEGAEWVDAEEVQLPKE